MSIMVLEMETHVFLRLMEQDACTGNELRSKILAELERTHDNLRVRRAPGRPMEAKHPTITDHLLKLQKERLFLTERIGSDAAWENTDGKKPTKFAVDQTDMGPDEVRLDNGIIALLNIGSELPPMPMPARAS